MISCKEASWLMSEGLDKQLGFAQRIQLRLHMMMCTSCSRVQRQFAFLRRAAQRYPGPDDGDEGKDQS